MNFGYVTTDTYKNNNLKEKSQNNHVVSKGKALKSKKNSRIFILVLSRHV